MFLRVAAWLFLPSSAPIKSRAWAASTPSYFLLVNRSKSAVASASAWARGRISLSA